MASLPLASRTGQPAIDYTRGRIGGTMHAAGYCLQFTRECFAIPPLYASAIDAWNAAAEQHPGDANPPAAVPVWFRSSSPYRHVAFHLGGGQYGTTYNADIRQMSFNSMLSSFGPLMGWAPDLNGYLVVPGAEPPAPPPPEEEFDTVKPLFIRRNDGAIVIINGNGAQPMSFDHWQVWQNLGYSITFDDMDPGPFNAIIEDMGGWAPTQ